MTANPNFLAAASAFNSFKNFGSFTGSVDIAGTIGFTPPTNFAVYSVTFDLQRTDAVIQIYMETTADSGKKFSLVGNYAPLRVGSVPIGGATPYNLLFTQQFVGTNLTVQASITNPTAETLTVVTETITFTVKTFITPFST